MFLCIRTGHGTTHQQRQKKSSTVCSGLSHTLDFQYFARIGDDAYFRPDEFYKQARHGEFPSKLAVIGQFIGPLPYPAAGKHGGITYPSGGGYVVTYDVAAFISKSAPMLNTGFPEDANFGAWLAGTKAVFVDIRDKIHDWDTGSPHYNKCSPKEILVHHMRNEADWERIDSAGTHMQGSLAGTDSCVWSVTGFGGINKFERDGRDVVVMAMLSHHHCMPCQWISLVKFNPT